MEGNTFVCWEKSTTMVRQQESDRVHELACLRSCRCGKVSMVVRYKVSGKHSQTAYCVLTRIDLQTERAVVATAQVSLDDIADDTVKLYRYRGYRIKLQCRAVSMQSRVMTLGRCQKHRYSQPPSSSQPPWSTTRLTAESRSMVRCHSKLSRVCKADQS
jgi:hypothetical protein